jgi:hypothetical protein
MYLFSVKMSKPVTFTLEWPCFPVFALFVLTICHNQVESTQGSNALRAHGQTYAHINAHLAGMILNQNHITALDFANANGMAQISQSVPAREVNFVVRGHIKGLWR